MKCRLFAKLTLLSILLFFPLATFAQVLINEIAWMGTTNSTADEWIELANTVGDSVDLTGWTLEASDGTPKIALSGSISAGGFFLLERTGDDTVPDVSADQIYTGALGNSGETLVLKDSSGSTVYTVDASGGWPAGDNATKQTMQRDGSNWVTADPTPRQANANPPEPTSPPAPTVPSEPAGGPTPTPTPESTPTPTPISTPTPTSTPQTTPTQSPTPTPQPSAKPTPAGGPTPSPLASSPTPMPSKSANPTIVAGAPNSSANIPPPKQPALTKPTQAKSLVVASVPSVTGSADKEEKKESDIISRDDAAANVSANQNPYLWLGGSVLAGLALGAFVIFVTRWRNQTDL